MSARLLRTDGQLSSHSAPRFTAPRTSGAGRTKESGLSPSIDHLRLPGLTLGKAASRSLERGTWQRCLSACLHRTDAQQPSTGLFHYIEGVAMVVSHMPHDDGPGAYALDCKFVEHLDAFTASRCYPPKAYTPSQTEDAHELDHGFFGGKGERVEFFSQTARPTACRCPPNLRRGRRQTGGHGDGRVSRFHPGRRAASSCD